MKNKEPMYKHDYSLKDGLNQEYYEGSITALIVIAAFATSILILTAFLNTH